MASWAESPMAHSPHAFAASFGGASPPRLSQQLAEQDLLREAEQDLRAEIHQCQRSLRHTQGETLAAESQAQEAEEAHQQELAVLCAQLDALDRHLLTEHQQQSEESHVARSLLDTASEQLNEMQDELRAAQAQTELIESESRHGRPQLDALASQLQRSLREEHAMESEVESMCCSSDSLRRDLSHYRIEAERLGEHRWHLEEALERATGQINSFEHWSEGVHDELREVAAELHEDRLAGDLERQGLQERIAELERSSGAVELEQSLHGVDGEPSFFKATDVPVPVLSLHSLEATSHHSLNLAGIAYNSLDGGSTTHHMQGNSLRSPGHSHQSLRDDLGSNTSHNSLDVRSGSHQLHAKALRSPGRSHQSLRDSVDSCSASVASAGNNHRGGGSGHESFAAPVVSASSLHRGGLGYEAAATVPTPVPPSRTGPISTASVNYTSPDGRGAVRNSAMGITPPVLWCRKAPSQMSMGLSPSAPALA